MAESEKTKVESKEEAGVCVCLKCYKTNCKSRSNPKEYCPELSGPLDWKGRPINADKTRK